MAEITKKNVRAYFLFLIGKHPDLYLDCGEVISTKLAEDAQYHFTCMTEEGKSQIEQDIFDWATEFAIEYERRQEKKP